MNGPLSAHRACREDPEVRSTMDHPSPVTRRTVLRAGAVGAAALAGTAAGIAPAGPAAAARPDVGVSVFPFPLGAVQLLSGPFAANTSRTHSYLNFLDLNRLLHTFRVNVGLA